MSNELIHEPDYKSILRMISHELRVVADAMMSSCEILSKATSGSRLDEPTVRHHTAEVFESVYILRIWLDIADLESDPNFLSTQERLLRSLYGKFHKAQLALKRKAKERGVVIRLHGTGKYDIAAYPIIDALPYILFDNALKYCPRDSGVDVVFQGDQQQVSVILDSVGPVVSPDELPFLFNDGFRAANAVRSRASGRGKGLALVAMICRLHGGNFEVEAGPMKLLLNDIPYGDLRITLHFDVGHILQ